MAHAGFTGRARSSASRHLMFHAHLRHPHPQRRRLATEVCSRGVRCGSRVCASNHCARCVRAHGVHVHRMHVLLTDERNHARDSDRENEMPEASLAPWPRAVGVGVCHCVHRRLPTCSPPPIQGGLSLARAVSRSLVLARSPCAHTLLTVFLIDKHISQRERERARARERERERYRHAHTHMHSNTHTHIAAVGERI